MNISATLNTFRLIQNPALCLPQATISNFNHLPLPISLAFSPDGEKPDIRAVVLDKDNCFARPKENDVYKPYDVGWFPHINLFFSTERNIPWHDLHQSKVLLQRILSRYNYPGSYFALSICVRYEGNLSDTTTRENSKLSEQPIQVHAFWSLATLREQMTTLMEKKQDSWRQPLESKFWGIQPRNQAVGLRS